MLIFYFLSYPRIIYAFIFFQKKDVSEFTVALSTDLNMLLFR